MKRNIFSLVSKGLRYKLRVAFYLSMILPTLIFLYLVSDYILPYKGLETNLILLILVSIFIGIGGFYIVRDVIRRVVNISSQARSIAGGDYHQNIEPAESDELGDLGASINILTQQIRDNMEELKNYGKKSTEFNLEIQRRVIVLSSLLQISSLISQGGKLDDILILAVEKSRQITDSDIAYLLIKDEDQEVLETKVIDAVNAQHLLNLRWDIEQSIFNNCIKKRSVLVLDSKSSLPEVIRAEFYKRFSLKNTLAVPMYSRGRLLGILGIGNSRGNFIYRKEDIELLEVFAKNIAIAIESDRLVHRVERLEIKDVLTGLYNEKFIRHRLKEEINRSLACHRPCSLILLRIDNFRGLAENLGSRFAEDTLRKVGTVIGESVSGIDRVGRFGDDEFAVILPEQNKRRAMETEKQIREKIEFSFSGEVPDKRVKISCGLSENPLDGIDAEELIQNAKASMG